MPKDKRKKWNKGTNIQQKAVRIHQNSKKQGKKLNQALKKTAQKLRKTLKRQSKERARQEYIKQGGVYCSYCREPHNTQKCPKLTKKLSKASTKRAAKIRRKARQLDKRAASESGNKFVNTNTNLICAFCKGPHTASDCPTLDEFDEAPPPKAAVAGAVPVFDFGVVTDED